MALCHELHLRFFPTLCNEKRRKVQENKKNWQPEQKKTSWLWLAAAGRHWKLFQKFQLVGWHFSKYKRRVVLMPMAAGRPAVWLAGWPFSCLAAVCKQQWMIEWLTEWMLAIFLLLLLFCIFSHYHLKIIINMQILRFLVFQWKNKDPEKQDCRFVGKCSSCPVSVLEFLGVVFFFLLLQPSLLLSSVTFLMNSIVMNNESGTVGKRETHTHILSCSM